MNEGENHLRKSASSADKPDFFPPRPPSRPTIYAYADTNPQYAGLLKVGYTTVDAPSRVARQYPTLRPGKPPYRIVLEESAMRSDGTVFTDRDVHRMLRINGVKNPEKKVEEFISFLPVLAYDGSSISSATRTPAWATPGSTDTRARTSGCTIRSSPGVTR